MERWLGRPQDATSASRQTVGEAVSEAQGLQAELDLFRKYWICGLHGWSDCRPGSITPPQSLGEFSLRFSQDRLCQAIMNYAEGCGRAPWVRHPGDSIMWVEWTQAYGQGKYQTDIKIRPVDFHALRRAMYRRNF